MSEQLLPHVVLKVYDEHSLEFQVSANEATFLNLKIPLFSRKRKLITARSMRVLH